MRKLIAKSMFATFTTLAGVAALALTSRAEDAPAMVTYPYEGSAEDAALSLTTAIEAQGLKVDHISNVGDMLARTAEVAGADALTYDDAQVFQFCSATLSRKMMEINPDNLAFCPYQIFIYQLKDAEQAVIGYRDFPANEMQEVEDIIEAIIAEALAF